MFTCHYSLSFFFFALKYCVINQIRTFLPYKVMFYTFHLVFQEFLVMGHIHFSFQDLVLVDPLSINNFVDHLYNYKDISI